MTSTNDGKDVKSNQTSGQKGKSFYIELYKSLDGRLSSECELSDRTRSLCEAWRRVHSLCQHSAPTTHPHLLSWLQRHTARTILQTEWQSPKSKDEQKSLEEAIDAFIEESRLATEARNGVSPAWETQLRSRGEWFKGILANPWGHPVLRALLDPRGQRPATDEILQWLKEERGVMFVTRLRQLAASKCDDLAMSLVTAVMDRVRENTALTPDHEQGRDATDPTPEAAFATVLRTEAGFTVEVWELLTDIEFVLLHKADKMSKCIELAKQTPLRDGYQLVERLQSRLETSPREKKLWKNVKEVATLIAQVIIARCMVVPVCASVARTALYCCARSLARLLPSGRLPAAAASLAAPAATAAHLHTLAAAVHAQCASEMKPFVCELYVRAITAGMNELERLKLKTEKESEARSTEQTLCSWFTQLGSLLSASDRIKCECTLTAFSVHPSPAMYDRIKNAPILPPVAVDDANLKQETTSEFGSWATDSRTQTNLVKTSETLNIKQTQHQANVLSTAILTEGETLGLSPELCQDLAVLLSGPRLKTLSWDMDRELLLDNCRTYLERTHGGTRALTTELKYLNLDPKSYQHLPEEEDDENDVYYGIEKGYEHLVEFQEPLSPNAMFDFEETESAYSDIDFDAPVRRKKKPKKPVISSDDDSDPLNIVAEMKKEKKERPHSKERSKDKTTKEKGKERKKKTKSTGDSSENKERSRERRKESAENKEKKEKKSKEKKEGKEKKEKKEGKEKKEAKEKKPRKKKLKDPLMQPPGEIKPGSLSSLIGLKVAKITDAKAVKNPDTKLPGCVTDSDYDSQGKSSLASLNSDGNGPDVLFDGLFTDDFRSPDKCDPLSDRRSSCSNSEFSYADGQLVISRNQKLKTESDRLQNMTPHQTKPQAASTASNPPRATTVTDAVKKKITGLLEFRRKQNLLAQAQQLMTSPRQTNSPSALYRPPTPSTPIPQNLQRPSTPLNSSKPSPLHYPSPQYPSTPSPLNPSTPIKSPNAIIQPVFPEQQIISPKPVEVPEIPKVYINKKQMDQIKVLRDEVDIFLKTKFSPKPVIQYASKPMDDRPQPTTHNEYLNLSTQKPDVSLIATSNKLPTSQRETIEHKKPPEVIINANSNQKSLQQFLRELHESTNAGTGTNANKTTTLNANQNVKVKKEVKPMSRVAPVIPNVINKVESTSSHCAKLNNQGKKVETQLNTFARLSYMHKNKLQHAEAITNQENMLSRTIEEQRIAKLKCLQNNNVVITRTCNSPQNTMNKDDKNVVIQKVEKKPSVQQDHPLLSHLLYRKSPKMNECLLKTPWEQEKRKTESPSVQPKQSSLSEKDQNDLLLLLRQQNKLNSHPAPVSNTDLNSVNKIVNNPQCSNVSITNSSKCNPTTPVSSGTVIKNYPIEKSNVPLLGFTVRPASDVKQNLLNTKVVDCKTAKASKTASSSQIVNTENSVLKTYSEARHEDVHSKINSAKDGVSGEDWQKVMSALLSHKTPSRGPNALDMALKKESHSDKLRNQRIVRPTVMREASKEKAIAIEVLKPTPIATVSHSPNTHPQPVKCYTPSTVPKHYTNMDSAKMQPPVRELEAIKKQADIESMKKQADILNSEVEKLMQLIHAEHPKKVAKETRQPNLSSTLQPSKQKPRNQRKQTLPREIARPSGIQEEVKTKDIQINQDIKRTSQVEKPKRITTAKKSNATDLIQEKDPFISGISNSDYDLLEELMDDELRREIGELSSDEDSYRVQTSSVKNIKPSSSNTCSNVIKNPSAQQEKAHTTYPTTVPQSCRESIIQTSQTHSRTQNKPKILSDIKITSNLAANQLVGATIKHYPKDSKIIGRNATDCVAKNPMACSTVIHQPVNTNVTCKKITEQPTPVISGNQLNVVDPRNVIITAMPQNSLQNVVVIGSDLVYDPYSAIQSQINTGISNSNQPPYVTFNNPPNITVFQTTQFAAPVVNSIIIGNAMTVQTTPTSMIGASLDTSKNQQNSNYQSSQKIAELREEITKPATINPKIEREPEIHSSSVLHDPKNLMKSQENAQLDTAKKQNLIKSEEKFHQNTAKNQNSKNPLEKWQPNAGNNLNFIKPPEKLQHQDSEKNQNLIKSQENLQQDIIKLKSEASSNNSNVSTEKDITDIVDKTSVDRKKEPITIKPMEVLSTEINSNYNNNCERKVLKEVQEKQKLEDTFKSKQITTNENKESHKKVEKLVIETKNLKEPKNFSEIVCKKEIEKERLKNKRLAIINRVVNNRSSNPPIALSYTPLVHNAIVPVGKIDCKTHKETKQHSKTDNSNNKDGCHVKILKEETDANANSKENKSNVMPRRILLRSSNVIEVKGSEKETPKINIRKMKVNRTGIKQSAAEENASSLNTGTKKETEGGTTKGKEIKKVAKLILKVPPKPDDSENPKTINKVPKIVLKLPTKAKKRKSKIVISVSTKGSKNKIAKAQEIKTTCATNIVSKAQVNTTNLNFIDVEEALAGAKITKEPKLMQHANEMEPKTVASEKLNEVQTIADLKSSEPLNSNMETKTDVTHKKNEKSQDLNKQENKEIVKLNNVEPHETKLKTPTENAWWKSTSSVLSDETTENENKVKPMAPSDIKVLVPNKMNTDIQRTILPKEKTVEIQYPSKSTSHVKNTNESYIKTSVIRRSNTDVTSKKHVDHNQGKSLLLPSNSPDKIEGSQIFPQTSVTCNQNKLPTNRERMPQPTENKIEPSQANKQQQDKQSSEKPNDNCSMEYLKNNVIIEELPKKDGDTDKRCVRVKLPNGKTYKATVYGKMPVSFETIFADPFLKNTLLMNASQSRLYTLNVKQVSTSDVADPSKIIDTRIEEIKVHPKREVIETVNLLSDDEEENDKVNVKDNAKDSAKDNAKDSVKENIQTNEIEFNGYKVSSLSKDIFEQHRNQLTQKCLVNLVRTVVNENKEIDVTPNKDEKEDAKELIIIEQPIVYKTAPLDDKILADIDSVLADKATKIASASNVIEIDDSSNDSLNLLEACPILPIIPKPDVFPISINKIDTKPEEKICELKNLLLMDLGVVEPEKQEIVCTLANNISQNALNDKERSKPNPILKPCAVKLSRCDELVEKYEHAKIINQRCTVNLVRCDDMIAAINKNKNVDILLGSDDFIDVGFEDDVTGSETRLLSRSDSFSLLTDFMLYDEETTLNDESINDCYDYDRSSPVIDVFETIAAFKNYSNVQTVVQNTNKNLDISPLLCSSEWCRTKRELNEWSKMPHMIITSSNDSLCTNSVSDPLENTNTRIPTLKSLTAKMFYNSSILDCYAICGQPKKARTNKIVVQSPSHNLKRKLISNEVDASTSDTKILRTQASSGNVNDHKLSVHDISKSDSSKEKNCSLLMENIHIDDSFCNLLPNVNDDVQTDTLLDTKLSTKLIEEEHEQIHDELKVNENKSESKLTDVKIDNHDHLCENHLSMKLTTAEQKNYETPVSNLEAASIDINCTIESPIETGALAVSDILIVDKVPPIDRPVGSPSNHNESADCPQYDERSHEDIINEPHLDEKVDTKEISDTLEFEIGNKTPEELNQTTTITEADYQQNSKDRDTQSEDMIVESALESDNGDRIQPTTDNEVSGSLEFVTESETHFTHDGVTAKNTDVLSEVPDKPTLVIEGVDKVHPAIDCEDSDAMEFLTENETNCHNVVNVLDCGILSKISDEQTSESKDDNKIQPAIDSEDISSPELVTVSEAQSPYNVVIESNTGILSKISDESSLEIEDVNTIHSTIDREDTDCVKLGAESENNVFNTDALSTIPDKQPLEIEVDTKIQPDIDSVDIDSVELVKDSGILSTPPGESLLENEDGNQIQPATDSEDAGFVELVTESETYSHNPVDLLNTEIVSEIPDKPPLEWECNKIQHAIDSENTCPAELVIESETNSHSVNAGILNKMDNKASISELVVLDTDSETNNAEDFLQTSVESTVDHCEVSVMPKECENTSQEVMGTDPLTKQNDAEGSTENNRSSSVPLTSEVVIAENVSDKMETIPKIEQEKINEKGVQNAQVIVTAEKCDENDKDESMSNELHSENDDSEGISEKTVEELDIAPLGNRCPENTVVKNSVNSDKDTEKREMINNEIDETVKIHTVFDLKSDEFCHTTANEDRPLERNHVNWDENINGLGINNSVIKSEVKIETEINSKTQNMAMDIGCVAPSNITEKMDAAKSLTSDPLENVLEKTDSNCEEHATQLNEQIEKESESDSNTSKLAETDNNDAETLSVGTRTGDLHCKDTDSSVEKNAINDSDINDVAEIQTEPNLKDLQVVTEHHCVETSFDKTKQADDEVVQLNSADSEISSQTVKLNETEKPNDDLDDPNLPTAELLDHGYSSPRNIKMVGDTNIKNCESFENQSDVVSSLQNEILEETIDFEASVEDTYLEKFQENFGNSARKEVTLVCKDRCDLVLTGIEYEDPVVGTCYVFPIIDESDDVEEVVEVIQEIEENNATSISLDETNLPEDDCLVVKMPKTTYTRLKSRSSRIKKIQLNILKRKLDTADGKFGAKRCRKEKQTYDHSRTSSNTVFGKEYKRIIDYCSSLKFSFSHPFHKEIFDVEAMVKNWPITGLCSNCDFLSDNDSNDMLFRDEEDIRLLPVDLSFVDEINESHSEHIPQNEPIDETNFNMGFGEGSDRVIQNLEDVDDVSKFSAATLSDVKQPQPFLLSEEYDNYKEKLDNERNNMDDQLKKLKHYITYIQLRDKVRSFFQKTSVELSMGFETQDKDFAYSCQSSKKYMMNCPFDLCLPDFIEPCPVEAVVQVVQVGQLPVSAAAQNPVTCDPRVTQVSDASPSQCSVENSPQDDSQVTIKTEYTELTTADLTMPLVQEYAQHNQDLPVESQNASNISASNENIPIETEIKSVIKIELEELPDVKEENRENYESNEFQSGENKNDNNVEYSFESNSTANSSTVEAETEFHTIYNSSEKQNENETYSQNQKQQNGTSEKTDQIAHAMNAAGITTTAETMTNATRAHALVNILSQKLRQGAIGAAQSTTNTYPKTTAINAMALQQALAQILPPPLNQTNVSDNNQQSSNTQITPQVLHIVQGKNATGSQITLVDNSQQSVINNPNATPVLHIVQNKSGTTNATANGTATSQTNSFSGLSLVDAGLQQGGNQLLHIVNTGSQKNSNATGQLLKRVNLLTNLTNVQGNNEQKMVQFVCKSADGKSIQLNAPHQRSMVLRLQPIETPNVTVQPTPPKTTENQDVGTNSNTNTLAGKDNSSQQEIKSRSVYEENYAKFIQNSSNKTTTIQEKSTSLPKFNQAFGKPVFQEGTQKSEINSNNPHLPPVNNNNDNNECQSNDNAMNLDHIGQISSPPLLLRKSPQTSQSQANLVQQLKQTIAPMNIQTMHGGVIYTRQIPVNIGGGQTINLITVPSTELIDDSAPKQQSGNQNEIEQSIIKIVPQNQNNSNTEMPTEENNVPISGANENTQNSQPQPVLTQMRIKLPMLSKAPQMVSGARVVRPSFFQIQRNVIGGANQPVYQQLVLTAAPPLGQQTIRLPQTQTNRPINKVPTENQSSAESQMSSSTLEQLREFDMVLEQVKERSTVQPSSSANTTFPKLHTATSDTTDSGASASSTSTESTQQVLYSIGNNQPLNVAYVNRKATVTTPTTSAFVRSPDSSGIVDSPTSSTHVQIPHTVTSETTQNEAPSQPKPAKVSSKSKSRPKASSNPPNNLKLNTVPPKTSAQKPLEDEQTTQRILYILAEYKEQVENSPDKDKPAPRRRSNPPSNPGSSKRKKSSSGSRRHGARDLSPVHGEDTCRTMGSEDSSCGTSQGDCNESCLESHSPQDSPRKVVRKLTFEQETPTTPQPRPQPQRNVIVADGQTITVARGTAGKPATAVLMPANYILPVSMVKGGQQIAIVTNRGPKLLTVGGGEGGATNALLLQRLIGPAGLKPVLARPGVRHVRLPTAALHNLQAFNLATTTTVQPPDSTASPAPAPTPPELVDTRATSSPWTDREMQDVKPERASSPEGSEPWNLPSGDHHDYSYEETVRTDNLDRTVLDPIPDRYSPDMEAQRIFDKMFDVESKKSYMGDSHDDSPRCAYDIDASDCDDKAYHQVVQKKDGSSHRQHRLTHVSAAALRHKYAILEHELRLQKSLSEECEDLGVDSPSASELFPEAELLFAASPAHDHTQDQGHHSHTPQPTLLNQSGIPQPDIDDQIATDQLLSRSDVGSSQRDLNLGLEDVGIVTVSADGMQATIALDQEEFARAHPNTTFHSEPTDIGEVQPFTITGLKGRHITSTIFHSNRAPATVLMTTPQTTVISQATTDTSNGHNVKYDIDNMINSLPSSNNANINLASVLVKDDGLTRFDNILNDSRELHLSNTASAIVHSAGNAAQVIRRVCYDEDKRDNRFLMDEPDALIAGDDAKMIAEDSSRDATLESMAGDVDDDRSSPERHAELFWESNSASASESRRPLDFSSDSEKCCKSPSYDETNSTDSSGVGTHMRLDSVIKEARGIERSGSADGSSADDTHPPLRTYPPKRMYHPLDGEVERSLSGKTRAGERSPDSLEVRRRASGRGVVKRGCHCCNGSPAPPRPKKSRQRKPTIDFSTN